MKLSFSNKIIYALTSISFVSVIILTISHLMTGNTCPLIFGIPACFALFFFVLLVLISHMKLVNDKNILFFVGAGLTILVAVFASVSNFQGSLECPKLFGEIPLCYLSLITFGAIINLKIIEIKA